jgi:hypothetical protein
MERANSNETSIELSMNELDTITETKVLVAVCLLSPAFLLGFAAAVAVRTLQD